MFRHLLSILSLLCMIVSPAVADLASVSHVNTMRDNVQAKIDSKAQNDNYAQNMVLQTDGSGNVVATTVGTDLFADGSIETMHLADGAVTNADLAGMIDIKKLNLGTLPTSGKHIMIWNAETNEYVFERYATSILPDGYTQLEYIESTGTQYINTGKVGNSTYNYKFTYQKTEQNNPTAMWGARMGSSYNTGAYFAFSYVLNSTAQAVCYFSDYVHGAPYSSNYYANGLDTKKHTFECTPVTQIAYLDGNTWPLQKQTTTIEWETTIPLVLFATNTPGGVTATNRQKMKVWEFSAQKPNGEYDFHLIPSKRNSDGEAGMYDIVTKTFFTNAGTGNFIAGPEI